MWTYTVHALKNSLHLNIYSSQCTCTSTAWTCGKHCTSPVTFPDVTQCLHCATFLLWMKGRIWLYNHWTWFRYNAENLQNNTEWERAEAPPWYSFKTALYNKIHSDTQHPLMLWLLFPSVQWLLWLGHLTDLINLYWTTNQQRPIQDTYLIHTKRNIQLSHIA